MDDNVELVMCTLKDVLGEKKFVLIDEKDVIVKLNESKMDDDMIDYSGIFHPNRKINLVVQHFVSLHKKRKIVKQLEVDNTYEDGNDGEEVNNNEEEVNIIGNDTKLLPSLVNVYPDVDQRLLRQICAKFQNDSSKIQDWLETNIEEIPEKKQVQTILRFTLLESSCGPEQVLWSCPSCETWQVVERKLLIVRCSEVVSCGDFCTRCGRKEHSPFVCRARSARIDNMVNEFDIFKKLKSIPDEDKGFVKVFVLHPQNNLDFSNPLHILYLAAEGTFLRMIDKSASSPQQVFTSRQSASASSNFHLSGPSSSASNTQPFVSFAAWKSSIAGHRNAMSRMFNPPPFSAASGTLTYASSSLNFLPRRIPPPPSASSSTPNAVPSIFIPPPPSAASSTPSAAASSTTNAFPRMFIHPPRPPVNNIIKSIKYVENEAVRNRFNSRKSYFVSRGIPYTERLVFHGTSAANLDSIIEHNFNLSLCKRSAHGQGIYFSEFPNTSQVYGKKLLLCRVMVGNIFSGQEHVIPEQYQSKFVQPDEKGKAFMIIINNVDQILPAFIIEVNE